MDLLFTACQSQVRHSLSQGGLSEDELDRICFVSVHDAVLYAQNSIRKISAEKTDAPKEIGFAVL